VKDRVEEVFAGEVAKPEALAVLCLLSRVPGDPIAGHRLSQALPRSSNLQENGR
jgi:hypothetical protein